MNDGYVREQYGLLYYYTDGTLWRGMKITQEKPITTTQSPYKNHSDIGSQYIPASTVEERSANAKVASSFIMID